MSWSERAKLIGGEQTEEACIRKTRELYTKVLPKKYQLKEQKNNKIILNRKIQSVSDQHSKASEHDPFNKNKASAEEIIIRDLTEQDPLNPELNKFNKQKNVDKPKIVKQFWSSSDNRLLIKLRVSLRATSLEQIAGRLRRTKGACIRKFISLTDKALFLIQKENFQSKSSFWTKEKCEQLLSLCEESKLSWAQRAKEIGGGQTEEACVLKAQKLYMKVLDKKDRLKNDDIAGTPEQVPPAIEGDVNNSQIDLVKYKSKKIQWTEEKCNLLLEEGYKVSLKETTWENVAKEFGSYAIACYRQFRKLMRDFPKQSPNFWTPEKQQLLLSLYLDTSLSWDARAEQIGCHKNYCRDELLRLTICKPERKKKVKTSPKKGRKLWSPSDRRKLIKLAIKRSENKITWSQIVSRIDPTRTENACEWEFKALKKKALSLIRKKDFQSESPFWTQKKCEQLLKLCKMSKLPWTQRAEVIGQTKKACIHKIIELCMKTLPKKHQLEERENDDKIKMSNAETRSDSDEALEYDLNSERPDLEKELVPAEKVPSVMEVDDTEKMSDLVNADTAGTPELEKEFVPLVQYPSAIEVDGLEELIRGMTGQRSLRTPMNDDTAITPEPEQNFAIASGQFPAMMEVDETTSLEEFIRGLIEQASLRTPMNDDTAITPELEKEAEMSPKDIFAAEEFILELIKQASLRTPMNDEARTPEPEQNFAIASGQLPAMMEVDVNSRVDLMQSKSNKPEWTTEKLDQLLELGYEVELGRITWEEIAEKFGRDVASCEEEFSRLKENFETLPLNFWTQEKEWLLLSLYLDTTLSWDERAEQIGCHKNHCMHQLLKLGMFNKPEKSPSKAYRQLEAYRQWYISQPSYKKLFERDYLGEYV